MLLASTYGYNNISVKIISSYRYNRNFMLYRYGRSNNVKINLIKVYPWTCTSQVYITKSIENFVWLSPTPTGLGKLETNAICGTSLQYVVPYMWYPKSSGSGQTGNLYNIT